MFPVFSAIWFNTGCMLRQFTEAFGMISHVFQVVQVVHIPVVALMRLLMIQTLCQTIDIPQLLTRWLTSLLCMIVQILPVVVQTPFSMVQTVRRTMVFPQFVLNKVLVVPVVQVERDPHVPSWLSSCGAAHRLGVGLIG